MAMSFSEKYEKPFKSESAEKQDKLSCSAAVEDLGFEELVRCLPYTLEVLQEKYKDDKHFNNTSLKAWNFAAGFNIMGSLIFLYRSTLRTMLLKKGINAYSCAQGVHLLKSVARKLVEEQEKGEKSK